MPTGDERDADQRGFTWLVTNSASRRAACYALGFHVLTVLEEAGMEPATAVSLECKGEEVEVGLPSGCRDIDIEEVEQTLKFITGLKSLSLNIVCRDVGSETFSANTLSRQAVNEFIKGYAGLLKTLVRRSHEYFIVVGWNGLAIAGLGGEEQITLPVLKAALIAHTHPKASCTPSYKDLESTAYQLAEGTVATLVAGVDCITIARLVRPLAENEYWAILDTASKLRKVKDPYEVVRLFTKLSRLETVEFSVEPLH